MNAKRAILTHAVLCLLLAGCSDVTTPETTGAGPGVEPPRTAPPSAPPLSSVSCTASRSGVQCAEAPTAGQARAAIYGGQRKYVLLESANVTYDSVSRTFAFDVTLTNLLSERIGADGRGGPDGGVSVFMASGPIVTAGEGSAEVQNPDGWGTFTGAGQPFWHWPGSFGPGEKTPAKRWTITMPPTVEHFTFSLLVSAARVPFVVYDVAAGDGGTAIFRIGLDGRDRKRLTNGPAGLGSMVTGWQSQPTIGGDWLVYRDELGRNLWRVPLSGGTAVRITAFPSDAGASRPDLSADGSRLAFVRDAPVAQYARVWLAQGDGSGAVPLNYRTAGNVPELTPQWIGTDARPARLSYLVRDTAVVVQDTTSWGTYHRAFVIDAWNSTKQTGYFEMYRGHAWDAAGERVAFFGKVPAPTGETWIYWLNSGVGWGGNKEWGIYVKDTRTGQTRRIAPTRFPEPALVFRPEVETIKDDVTGPVAWTNDGRVVFLCIDVRERNNWPHSLCWVDPDVPGMEPVWIPGTADPNLNPTGIDSPASLW